MRQPKIYILSSAIILLVIVNGALHLAIENKIRQSQRAINISLPISENAAVAPTPTSTPIFQPEIPVNEYWDFQRYPDQDRRIYINNTDKNVVYILNNSGKIVATFWGKDYDLNRFEARIKRASSKTEKSPKELLCLTGYNEKTETIVVIDPVAAKVLWQKKLPGSIDMPQSQVLDDGTWLLENYGVNPGVHLMHLEPQTGKIIWEINDPNYFGMYFNYPRPTNAADQLETWSGGVGRGNWKFKYLVEAATGKILNSEADLDWGYESYFTDLKLNWYLDAKKIVLRNFDQAKHQAGSEIWTMHPGDKLYDTIFQAGVGHAEISISKKFIFVRNHNEAESKESLDVFSVVDGSWLWRKNFGAGANSLYSLEYFDGVLVTIQIQISSCSNVCKTSVCQGWICFDIPPTAECTACWKKERDQADYRNNWLVAYDGDTGDTLWSYSSKEFFIEKFDHENNTIIVKEDDDKKITVLDAKTGAAR